jgi:hypothetical protein
MATKKFLCVLAAVVATTCSGKQEAPAPRAETRASDTDTPASEVELPGELRGLVRTI